MGTCNHLKFPGIVIEGHTSTINPPRAIVVPYHAVTPKHRHITMSNVICHKTPTIYPPFKGPKH